MKLKMTLKLVLFCEDGLISENSLVLLSLAGHGRQLEDECISRTVLQGVGDCSLISLGGPIQLLRRDSRKCSDYIK